MAPRHWVEWKSSAFTRNRAYSKQRWFSLTSEKMTKLATCSTSLWITYNCKRASLGRYYANQVSNNENTSTHAISPTYGNSLMASIAASALNLTDGSTPNESMTPLSWRTLLQSPTSNQWNSSMHNAVDCILAPPLLPTL